MSVEKKSAPENEELKSLPTTALVEFALKNDFEDDARSEAVRVLHKRGDKSVFDAAKKLCESQQPNLISLGADVLGQLGLEKLPFKAQSVPLLLELSEAVADIDALQSVVFALGRMDDEKCVARLLELAEHSSEDIRFAVVHGLPTLENDEIIINALIKLSDDSDADVRNWATFALGSLITADTPIIREALLKRLGETSEIDDDLHREIAGEALVGLAIRKDERVIEPLRQALTNESVGRLPVEAASEIADKTLCAELLKLRTWWDMDEDLLKSAIKACCTDN